MISSLMRNGVKLLLWLRYRVRVRGREQVARRGTNGILFLPNHPALIDPIIVMAHLHKPFAPRVLADQDQISRRVIRWFARRVGAIPVPDPGAHGPETRRQVETATATCIEALRRGDNLVLYPAGHVYRTRFEDLRGNSAVETILRELPDARVVLVRTRGLWGSGFSYASGSIPNVARFLKKAAVRLLLNGILFSPRRHVTIELHEPEDVPRTASRNDLNRYLETFYNQDAPPNTYVPYTIWERTGTVTLPDPETRAACATSTDVHATVRQRVIAHLGEVTGCAEIDDGLRLAQDLGMDSLARAELVVWLGTEFGFSGSDVDSLRTVGDVMLAAGGESIATRLVELQPAPALWFRDDGPERVTTAEGDTIAACFLEQARRHPNKLVVADQRSGAKSYRDLVTAILVLRPAIERLPGNRIGILLPASVAADVAYLAIMFAGKVPVMLNWTGGTRNTLHSLDLAGVQRVVTAGALVARIESQGTDLGEIKDRLVLLESLATTIGLPTRLWAVIRSRFGWHSLAGAKIAPIAAILFTSGSETLPKGVPLTHANILTNIRDVLRTVNLPRSDRMIGFLSPFHSFGLTVTMVAPLTAGLPVVHHANPTEALVLAKLIEAYRVGLLVGTPTFLSGIVRAATGHQLDSLRLAVTGAEKCPERTYEALVERCPNAVVLEGYGITECSPIVAVNDDRSPKPFTIGKVLPSLQYAIVNPETWQPVATNEVGMLLLRGPTVFDGYLGDLAESPFAEYGGHSWYRTGDLVSEDEDRVLTFHGRLKRFVKRGGEMISLPAIEAVLEQHYATAGDEGPAIAVESTPDEHQPELVLFTTLDLDRQTVNQRIRDGGLSPLHNISRVIRLESVPVLGTGKTNYRELKAILLREREREPSALPG